MDIRWQFSLLDIARTLSDILTAGVAVTAFALLLYALNFNLRDRVARTYAFIMACVVLVFTTEAFASSSVAAPVVDFWLRLQWVGVALLPAAYLHFSDALLATTGRPSRGRRVWAVRIAYLISFLFLLTLPFNGLAGPVRMDQPPAPHLEPTAITDLFTLFYLGLMALSWVNFVRAYRRTVTASSRRRMIYLLVGAAAPALGSFPYLLFSLDFSARHPLFFWLVAAFSNFAVSGLLVVMAYSVAFFGVAWPERVVRSRLFAWILRGPVVASVALGITTIVRRTGEALGTDYAALVPISMVAIILLGEYLVALFLPFAERWLFYGNDQADLILLRSMEDRLLTRSDLRQFFETLLSGICDRFQAPGAYVAALQPSGLELVVTVGKVRFQDEEVSEVLTQLVREDGGLPELFEWGNDSLIPLYDHPEDNEDGKGTLIGILGISGNGMAVNEPENRDALGILAQRASLALRDRQLQERVFSTLESLSGKVDYIQRLRAAGQYNRQAAWLEAPEISESTLSQWVRDALGHYWGGPKLTESPLMSLRVVARALEEHDGNAANALRSILRAAIEKVRPEGERRFTGEWVLYNILEMKFLEGKKVREIARRLAVSEADLYRKQRIAIDAVANAILDMENTVRSEVKEG